ncbi:MAG: RNA polymerase sigma factor (sigma-70 family) [Pirellulaceae bacterium]|jgi:RNA polymerase sigma factor (sigma-70 family)
MATQNQTINWEEQLEVHRKWLLTLARSRLDDSHSAEDILQDISLSVIRQNPQLEDPKKIRSWLYQVVVRRTTDYLRQRYRRELLLDRYSQFDERGQTDERGQVDERGQGEPEQSWSWMLAAEQRELLQTALGQLPDEDRQLVLLKFTKNWSYKQLAEKFGRTERAVEYRLVRAKQQLRAELQRLNGSEDD